MFLIFLKHQNNFISLDLNLFSFAENNITFIEKLIFPVHSDYHQKLYEFINNWWKINNLIDNSEINKIICEIHNINLEELNLINSKINSLSQVKSNAIRKIKFKKNTNIITFYGNYKMLFFALNQNNINIKINKSEQCIINLAS